MRARPGGDGSTAACPLSGGNGRPGTVLQIRLKGACGVPWTAILAADQRCFDATIVFRRPRLQAYTCRFCTRTGTTDALTQRDQVV